MNTTADDTHVNDREAARGNDPTVGDGTPQTAPHLDPDGTPGQPQWMPARKIAAAALAAGLVWIASRLGLELPDDEAQQTAELLLPVLVGYLTPSGD